MAISTLTCNHPFPGLFLKSPHPETLYSLNNNFLWANSYGWVTLGSFFSLSGPLFSHCKLKARVHSSQIWTNNYMRWYRSYAQLLPWHTVGSWKIAPIVMWNWLDIPSCFAVVYLTSVSYTWQWVGDMSWLAGIQSRGKVESRELPSGWDLHPCHSSSYSFRWEFQAPPCSPPAPIQGPGQPLGLLGMTHFSATVSASLPTGAASCNMHGSEWIEVMEQMAVTFSWDLPACIGTSDPEVNACAWSLSHFRL